MPRVEAKRAFQAPPPVTGFTLHLTVDEARVLQRFIFTGGSWPGVRRGEDPSWYSGLTLNTIHSALSDSMRQNDVGTTNLSNV